MDTNPFDLYTQEYEDWFKQNEQAFISEVKALKKVIQPHKIGVEIGIGSGLFAKKLGIDFGVDPSEKMLERARLRGLSVLKAFAEKLPYPDESFDYAAFITSLCFIKYPQKAIKEAYRIINYKGEIIIAFIDKNCELGKILENEKAGSKFYERATFYSVAQIESMLSGNGFKVTDVYQTLVCLKFEKPENPIPGHGKGSFVVIKAIKIHPKTHKSS